MMNPDKVRMAGNILEMLESYGYCKESIYEISELVKRHADVKEKYDSILNEPMATNQHCCN